MVGLRKAWFSCSVSWLLIVWMLLSPLALSWHLALLPNHAHGRGASCQANSASALSAAAALDRRSDTDGPQLSACPYGHGDSVTLQGTECCPQGLPIGVPSGHSSDGDHDCPICELLLLDDVWVMQWDDIPRALQLVQGEVVSGFCFVPNRIVLPWNVRGPPNQA